MAPAGEQPYQATYFLILCWFSLFPLEKYISGAAKSALAGIFSFMLSTTKPFIIAGSPAISANNRIYAIQFGAAVINFKATNPYQAKMLRTFSQ